jgi:hypothetical protein
VTTSGVRRSTANVNFASCARGVIGCRVISIVLRRLGQHGQVVRRSWGYFAPHGCPLCGADFALVDTGALPAVRCKSRCGAWSLICALGADRAWLDEASVAGVSL